VWVADNGTGFSTLYTGTGAIVPLVVTVPRPAGGREPATPTGIVFNGNGGFTVSDGGRSGSSIFIFDTEDGTISGWNPNVALHFAKRMVDNSGMGAVYKGLAIGTTTKGTFLYATNFNSGWVEIYDSQFQWVKNFTDMDIPDGYGPFGIRNINGKLYVTYAKQDADKEDDVAGPGNGFVDVFDTSGNLLRRFASQGTLNSPWGMVVSPPNFGEFSNALLVGNFGDGRINAFNISTGAFLGQLLEPSSRPLVILGLWGLTFGNGSDGADPGKLYFTAGIPGQGGELEDHGLFGEVRPQHP
jgi:uncharacterized protein (TIGR03118 family)